MMRIGFFYTATAILLITARVVCAQLGGDGPLAMEECTQLFQTLICCFLALGLALWLLRPYRRHVRRTHQRNRTAVVPPDPFVVVHRLPIYFFLCDRDGTTHFVNAKAERDFGVTNEGWAGKKLYEQKWFQGVPADEMKTLSEAWRTARLEEAAEGVDISAAFADGRRGVVSYYFYRIESGEILVYGIDVTKARGEPKAAEERAAE